jgi:hypothetical protein
MDAFIKMVCTKEVTTKAYSVYTNEKAAKGERERYISQHVWGFVGADPVCTGTVVGNIHAGPS